MVTLGAQGEIFSIIIQPITHLCMRSVKMYVNEKIPIAFIVIALLVFIVIALHLLLLH